MTENIQTPNTSTDEYYIKRSEKIKNDLENGINVYPHKFNVKNDIKSIISIYSDIEKGKTVEDEVCSSGRIMVIRNFGKTSFIKLMCDGLNIQLVVRIENKEDKINGVVKNLKRGDIIGYFGNPGRTSTGELSVFVSDIILLSPCLRTIPTEHFGIKDPELIYRKRHLDLLLNEESRKRFFIRSKVINFIRRYLDSKDFLEVETPMMNAIPGGAAAKPFVTYHNDLKAQLYMRISPELYLKTLVVGGIDRVYELGKQYRNEGVDLTHNPEFTSVEFYMAYADYEDLMDMTEELLNSMVKEIVGAESFSYHPLKRENRPDSVTLDFKKPFKRIYMLEELNKKLNLNLSGENLESKETLEILIGVCERENIRVGEPLTLTRILDKLCGVYLEPECVNPTFIIGHPRAMSPLAKKHRSIEGLTERFELFINCKEVVNAYTELNDPMDQRNRFVQQSVDKAAGDEEAMIMDEDFCQALEYGLPPTGGWGMGIDRLIMFLTNAANIRDVILFPAMKSESD
ncbi:lysine--tRNA ligase [Hamiltosporidium magnivora]|uniref:Probable lysine--tRNA ligase, cytoplasmic n=2 Tax=Hamiltosporidium TaxID=1176354 RepID=A0A4Q9L635_9MICR|nr:lysine--tRNA ligase [Hamiltosporidium magnivora]